MAQNLLNAIKNKDISLAKKMIRQGENVNQRDSNGATLLMWAVLKTDLTFCKYLIKKGADSKLKGVIYTDSTRSQYYGNILGICALNNHYDWLEWFVKHEKIPVDDRELNLADNTETGWTALQYAVYKGDEAGVNKLIKLGANRNYISPNDSANMLLEAVNYGHSDLAKKILGFTGINLNHSNIVGYNALHYAVFLNNYTVAEALLKAGIPVNSQSDSLITPLHAAITSYLPQMVGLIMQYFPDTSLTNKWGETPGFIARYYGYKGIANLLKGNNEMLLQPIFDSLYASYSRFSGTEYKDSISYYALRLFEQASKEYAENTGRYEQSLNLAGIGYYNVGKFMEAKQMFIRSLINLKKYRPQDTADQCQYLKNIISSSNELKQPYDSIWPYMDILIPLTAAYYGDTSERYLEAKRMKIYYQALAGPSEMVIKEYNELIAYCIAIKKNRSDVYYNILNSLLVLHADNHRVNEALSVFNIIYKDYQSGSLPASFDFRHSVKNICVFLSNESSLTYLKTYLSLYRSLIITQKPLIFKDLYTYNYLKGSYYYESNINDSAVFFYKNAITIAKNYSPVQKHELAACYINVVNAYLSMDNVEFANHYLDTSLMIYATIKQMAAGYYNEINTAQIDFYNRGDYIRCLQLNKVMMDIAVAEGDSIRYVKAKKNAFYAAYKDGQLDYALHSLQEILIMEQRFYKERPEEQIPFFKDLGYFYTELKDSAKAIEYYRKVLIFSTGLPQKDSIQLQANYKISQLSRADKAGIWLAKEVARIEAKKVFNQLEEQILEDYIKYLGDKGETDKALNHCEIWVDQFTNNNILKQSEWVIKQGDIFNRRKEYARAEPYYRGAEKLLLTKYSANSKEMVLVYAKLGNNNYLSKKYDIAIPYMKKVIEVEEQNAAAIYDLVSYYNSLKIIYFGINDMSMAEYYSDKLIANNSRDEMLDFPAYLKSKVDHLNIKQTVGKFEEAELICNELASKMYTSKRYTAEDRLKIYGQMGYFYSEIGNRNKAILCVDSSSSIVKKHFPNNPNVSYRSTIQKALIYITNDKSEEGLFQLKQQYQLLKNQVSDTSDILNETISYLGLAYLYRKEMDSAKQVLHLVENNYLRRNIYNSSLLSAIKYIAAIHSFKKEHDSALAKLQLARNLVLNEKGMLENYWSLTLGIANTFSDLKQNDSAIKTLEYILSNQNSLGFTNDELLEETRLAKAFVLSAEGKYDQAFNILSKYLCGRREAVLDDILFLSASERETFLSKKGNSFRTINLELIPHLSKAPQYANLILDNELFIKGLALETNTRLLQLAGGSGDPENIKLMDLLKTGRNRLEEMYKQGNSNDAEVTELENKLTAWEKSLNKRLGVNFKADYNRSYTNELRNKMKSDEMLIDFFSRDKLSAADNDTIFYYAIVLAKDYEYPKVVKVTSNKALDKLFANNENLNSAAQLARIYETRGSVLVNKSQVDFRNCYDLIWQTIDSLSRGKKNIYITPSGYLNKISFAAIKDPKQTYISDKYNIHILSSSRQLLKPINSTAPKKKSGVILGGINYDADSVMISGYTPLATRSYTFDGDSARRAGFTYLEGTLTETKNIVSYLSDRKFSISFLTGKQATEEYFKKIQTSQPYFIHVATHGFYLPDSKSKLGLIPGTVTKAENPLLRSGLMLAGGNKAWLGQPIPAGKEDGILNSFEISNLDLSKTKFVVLSACETGLGDIKGSEGVFGLQRAFKLAGVEYIINSLWQVPDAQTSELMQAFYFNWVKGMAFEDAFFQAQKTLKAKYPPYYWAAFQLVR